MATTREQIDRTNNPHPSTGQSNSKSIEREASSERRDVDNGPNQVSDETKDTPREPGIARVGNTSPEEKERH